MKSLKNSHDETRPLGGFLKDARIKAGLTQQDVATALGYSTIQFVSNWERGLKTPPGVTLIKLTKLYGISVEDLYEILFQERVALVKRELKEMLYKRNRS